MPRKYYQAYNSFEEVVKQSKQLRYHYHNFKEEFIMEQKLAQLQAKIEADKGLAEKLFSMENAQDVQALLKEQGLDFSFDEINVMKEALVKALEKGGSSELSDDDLENVAGGIAITAIVALIGAIVGAVTAAGAVTDQAVRSRW